MADTAVAPNNREGWINSRGEPLTDEQARELIDRVQKKVRRRKHKK
jgi:hypothetical protein